MNGIKLFMVLLGCRPEGRFTEQHDVFFGIGDSLRSLVPDIKKFWPEANGKIHIDAWREVTNVDGFEIEIRPKSDIQNAGKLFFINLGGYKENELEEYHYKMLAVATSIQHASKRSKATAFFKHYNLAGSGVAHIDDKYGVDVDDIHNVSDILLSQYKNLYSIRIGQKNELRDELHIGYLRLDKLK